MSHTKGPWTSEFFDVLPRHSYPRIGIYTTRNERGMNSRRCIGWVDEDNANLVSAAPDLLSALQRLLRSFESAAEQCPNQAVKQAREAIAKAKEKTA